MSLIIGPDSVLYDACFLDLVHGAILAFGTAVSPGRSIVARKSSM
jgi:hypothetical protein